MEVRQKTYYSIFFNECKYKLETTLYLHCDREREDALVCKKQGDGAHVQTIPPGGRS